ncbi:N(4)-(Beta-N-acetylglucosaminyl)-L-asparaginase-like [Euwallacea fornicatus]|uniref:N(4)-(Beta-N-acetylglucosaminyl)-L-asparaginase- like n=1 Tax=Euwallacea fornicatus TaxID=995702 RepID=UPI00338E733A
MFLFTFTVFLLISTCQAGFPVVVNTWAFIKATQNAWTTLQNSNQAIDALIEGCRTCQSLQCDFTVGYGGSPDEEGETTLDALIFDGNTMNMGAVGGIRNVKDAIGVARRVLENTDHSFLVGSLAGDFAHKLGFPNESLETNYSKELYNKWKNTNCQPNFWSNVIPDSTTSCGPYVPKGENSKCSLRHRFSDPLLTNEVRTEEFGVFNTENHDTIGMIVINSESHIVAGTSTNGANHKIPGRVGDSPIPGAGAYADAEVGAATATGDGDVMMRFLPSFLAVELMRQGATPTEAAQVAVDRIAIKFPTFFGGIIAVNKNGSIGAACNGMEKFPYSVMNSTTKAPVIEYAICQ